MSERCLQVIKMVSSGYQYTIHLARIEDWIVLTNPQNTFAPNKAKLEEF
jgi:hypothetical protein